MYRVPVASGGVHRVPQTIRGPLRHRIGRGLPGSFGLSGQVLVQFLLVRHEDRFFLFNEAGELILARLSPERYEELGRAPVLEPTNQVFGRSVLWSHPAFAERSLFARNDRELVRVCLAADE